MNSYRYILLIFLVLTTIQSNAQFGYKGKKSLIGIQGIGNVALFQKIFSPESYLVRNDEMSKKVIGFGYGLSISYDHVVASRTSLGTALLVRDFSVTHSQKLNHNYGINNYSYSDSTEVRIEDLKFRSYSLILRAHFSPKFNYAGSGLYHSLGIGYTRLSPIERNYAYSLNESGSDTNWTNVDYYEFKEEWSPIFAIPIYYGIHVNYPLNESILFKIGTEFLLNIHIKPKQEELFYQSSGPYNYGEAFDALKQQNLLNWNLSAGFVFAL